MPYLVASIIAIVSATIILLTRYEADDTAITSEIEKMKSMFSIVDGFVNTYIALGLGLDNLNFETLNKEGILFGNMTITGTAKDSILTFPSSDVKWQLIPNKDDSRSYKVLVDMRNNKTFMSKAQFSESFSGREFCQKSLFGNFEPKGSAYSSDVEDFGLSGSEKDGLFVCIVFK